MRGFLNGIHEVRRHEDDGTITEVGDYVDEEHAMFNAVNHYLFLRKAVKVYVNLIGQTTIEEIPHDSTSHPDYRAPVVSGST